MEPDTVNRAKDMRLEKYGTRTKLIWKGVKMNLSMGCNYCSNLVADKLLTEFSCRKDSTARIENAGVCFVRDVNGCKVIVESCPDFEESIEIRNER